MVYYAKSRTSLLFGNTKIYLGDFGNFSQPIYFSGPLQKH